MSAVVLAPRQTALSGGADVIQGVKGRGADKLTAPFTVDRNVHHLIIQEGPISDDLAKAIEDGSIVETTDGAGTFTITVFDPTKKLQRGTLLRDWMKVNPPIYDIVNNKRKLVPNKYDWKDVNCTIDGRDFSLAQVTKTGKRFDLVFENRAVHELRKVVTPRTWNRAQFTRAEVIQATLDEIAYPINFVCPELTKIQPITSSKLAPTTVESTGNLLPGYAPATSPVNTTPTSTSGSFKGPCTVKGIPASSAQLGYIARVINVGLSLNASYIVLVSAIETITQESDIDPSICTDPATGIGLFSQIPSDGWPATGSDVEADAAAYYNGIPGHAGAIAVAASNPGYSADQIAQAVQVSAYPTAYAQWQSEAENDLAQYGITGGTSTAGTPTTSPTVTGGGTQTVTVPGNTTITTSSEYNAYLFARGNNGQSPGEDSWTFDQRLASEVQWYLFMVDNTLYYVNANDWVKSAPWDIISEDDPGIDYIDYSLDWNKPRQTCTVEAHIDRWQCPAGRVVLIDDDGPADGRWIVNNINYPLFHQTAEITLMVPSPPKPEPAPTQSTTTKTATGAPTQYSVASPGSVPGSLTQVNNGQGQSVPISSIANPIDRVYAACIAITATHVPYGYDGHCGAWACCETAPDQDCSSSTSLALYLAGLMNNYSGPIVSGDFNTWGAAGGGKYMTVFYNSIHVWIRFYGYPMAAFSTMGGQNGPALLSTPPEPDGVAGGEAASSAHWPGY